MSEPKTEPKITDKIKFDLLDKLVADMKNAIQSAQNIADARSSVPNFIAELGRAAGLAGVVMQEATLLMKDIYSLANYMQTGALPKAHGLDNLSEDDLMNELQKIIGGVVGPSGTPSPKRGAN
jgi:hypothetical protein